MNKEFKLPELAEGVEAAEVTAILVEVGDRIEEEQPVIELETGKATAEIPSPTTGQVQEIKVKIGDEIKVGQVILTLEDSDEETERAEPPESGRKKVKQTESADDGQSRQEPPAETAEDNEETAEKPKPEKSTKSDRPEKRSSDQPSDQQKEADRSGPPPKAQDQTAHKPDSDDLAPAPGAQVPAAPSVRRFAREIGVDIEQVEGSGEHGRISVDDVKQHARRLLQARQEQPAAALAEKLPELPDFSRWGETRRQPLSRIRRETARHTPWPGGKSRMSPSTTWPTLPNSRNCANATPLAPRKAAAN